jgi:F0F1-type ATP synthase epsilon subunit
MSTAPLTVIINSPEKLVWEGKAEYVSSINSQGPFDILPMHSNFISILENKTIKVKPVGSPAVTYSFPRCVLYTHSNVVKIYAKI